MLPLQFNHSVTTLTATSRSSRDVLRGTLSDMYCDVCSTLGGTRGVRGTLTGVMQGGLEGCPLHPLLALCQQTEIDLSTASAKRRDAATLINITSRPEF